MGGMEAKIYPRRVVWVCNAQSLEMLQVFNFEKMRRGSITTAKCYPNISLAKTDKMEIILTAKSRNI